MALAASALSAHDLWIEPSDLAPRPGERVALRLLVGEALVGDPVPRHARGTARFSVLAPDAEIPTTGVEGIAPAGFFVPSAEGPHWAVYESRPHRLTLDAGSFESYLAEEGLERIVELRAERGESARPGRESYSRCAKSLIEVGRPAAAATGRLAGCPLELALDAPPAAGHGGLRARVVFRGRPLAGALVKALRKGADGPAVEVRSDAGGRVVFALERPGLWLIKTVHMETAAAGAGEVDWQSWWASLTFHLTSTEGDGENRRR